MKNDLTLRKYIYKKAGPGTCLGIDALSDPDRAKQIVLHIRLHLRGFYSMLPKLLAKLVASVVTLFLNVFPFATNPKSTVGVIEKT
jgi:hypothetical protein